MLDTTRLKSLNCVLPNCYQRYCLSQACLVGDEIFVASSFRSDTCKARKVRRNMPSWSRVRYSYDWISSLDKHQSLITDNTLNGWDKYWLSRHDDDNLVTNFPLKLTLRVNQRSCGSYTMSYDTPSNRGVVYTLAAGPQTTGNAALDNRVSRSLQEVETRTAF